MDWQRELTRLRPYASIGFCGAGGKTTNLWQLSEEIIKMQQKVLISTTTKMYPYSELRNDQIVSRETFDENLFNGTDRVQWFSKIDEDGKGHSPQISAIKEVHNNSSYWKLFEIDGAKRLGLKAPNEEEPIFPYALDWVYGCISSEVIGRRAGPEIVHRMKHFTEVTGCHEGEFIDLAVLQKLIESPKGLFQHKPMETGATVVFTKVRPEQLDLILELKNNLKISLEVGLWEKTLQK